MKKKQEMKISIIGGGIGGLTTAIGLQQKGIEVVVYEQATELKAVGAGILLAQNAMQVIKGFGLEEQIQSLGNHIEFMRLTDNQINAISSIDYRSLEPITEVQSISIHRAALQEVLMEKVGTENVKFGHALHEVERRGNRFILSFENGETEEAKYLIGADGINSTVRNKLFSENVIRNSGHRCWRGVCNFSLPEKYFRELNEAWGKGDRFGFMHIAHNKVYWYALKTMKGQRDFSKEELKDIFKNYHPLINEIIDSTEESKIHGSEITDLRPLKVWFDNNVCLVGDAAHATTPNLGQGACQAIEDAYVLSHSCDMYDNLNDAFAHYQKKRMPKAKEIVNTSWSLGKIAHLENPIATLLRNKMMKLTPSKITRMRALKLSTLDQA